MSCYILPAGSSTFVNFATVYPSSVIIGGSTWPTAPATGGIKLPAVTGLGTSAGADHLTAPTAITLVTPEVASSFLYQSLCHGTTPGSVQTSASSLPVATPSSSFCCVAPYSAAVAASGNFPFSVEPFPETGNVGKAVYTCNGMSTFRIVSNDVLSLSQSSKSSTASVIACSEPSGWRSPTGVAVGGGSPQEFYRLRRLLRRVRRRVGAGMTSPRGGIAAGDDEKEEECGSESAGGKYPLYCVVCRVKLNATAQAKQHYTGRSHARRVRLLYGPAVVTAAGTAADPALQSATDVPPGGSTANDSSSMISTTTSDDNHMDDVDHQVALVSSSVNQTHRPMFPAGTVSPVSCDVYCSACAVSFNSTTQARQHYHGKSHAKRLRTLHPELYASLSLCTASRTTTEGASAHKESSYVCFICNSCPSSHGQHVRISTSQLHSVNSGNNRSLKHCAASVSGINGRRRSIRATLHHDRK